MAYENTRASLHDHTMRVVSILSQKGGAGKTTLAVHLATAATLAGFEAAIVDLDQQATAEAWGDWREGEPPEVISAKPATLARELAKMERVGADFIVIDTPGAADAAARQAADVADLILIPCRPVAFDLHAIQQSAGLVKSSGKPGFVVFNSVPASTRSLRNDAQEIVRRYGLTVAPVWLADRAAYRRSVEQGKSVQETDPKSKADQEVATLWEWTREQVGMTTRKQVKRTA
jgi:chromosome partitioning protein